MKIDKTDGRPNHTLTVKSGMQWGRRLHDAGLLPQSCFDITIELPISGAGKITYCCHLTEDVAAALGGLRKLSGEVE